MKPNSRVIALCVLLVTSTGAWSRPPRSIEPADITREPSLIGKRVTLRACIGIPLFDNPDGGEEFVLLYPCGAELDEDTFDNGPAEGLIFGTFASDADLQPFADAKITFEGEVQADFTGKLTRRRIDDVDREKYIVLTIDRVANPTERTREEE